MENRKNKKNISYFYEILRVAKQINKLGDYLGRISAYVLLP